MRNVLALRGYVSTLLVFAINSPEPAFAQGSPRGEGRVSTLTRGADYQIGFTVLTVRDSSRAWERAPDAVVRGNGSRFVPRPIRISLWYPAQAASGAHMRVGDYLVHEGITDSLAVTVSRRLDARDRRTFVAQALDGAANAFDRTSGIPLLAVRDAPPSRGRFPLVLYSAGLNSFDADNAMLAEALARRGYIVAAVAQQGGAADGIDLSLAPADVETQVRDLEVAASVVRRREGVAESVMGIVGWSMGGVSAVLFQMRHPEISAVVTLDPSFGYRDHPSQMHRAPGFSVGRMTVPLLMLAQASADATDAVVDSLVYSDREIIRFPGLVHEDFTIGAQLAAVLDTRSARRSSGYPALASRMINEYVVAFIDANLRGDSVTLGALRVQPLTYTAPAGTIARRRVLRRPPLLTANEVALLIERSGLDTAAALVTPRTQNAAPSVTILERDVNALAYAYLGRGDARFALNLFRLNALAFPRSANAFDGLADALIATGDNQGASTAYRRVLELLPGDVSLNAATRDALRNNATRYLARIGAPPP